MSIVVTNIDRSAQPLVAEIAELGVATVHEAQGRTGLLDSRLRPIYRPASIAGTAVTCEVAPGDNWMIHVAAEQCQEGDVLVVTPTSLCHDGYFGDQTQASFEAQVLLNSLVERVARIELTGEPTWRLNNTLHGVDRLPIRLCA